jgi:hypothetical protein
LKVSGLFKRRPKDLAWLLLVLVFVSLLLHWPLSVRGSGEASASVGEADVAVGQAFNDTLQAFNATLDAERAGANVSGLIVRLDEAGSMLEEAEIALKNGDSSGAANNASLCIGIAASVNSTAAALKTSALVDASTLFWRYLTFSVVSIVVFVIVLAYVWRWFKRSYLKKALQMKPEVAANEA